MVSRKFLLGSVLVLVMALVIFSVIAYAANDDVHYYSYTKAIKYCGSDGCVMQDFIVRCLDDRVIDIEPMAERIHVPMTFERDDHFGWCES
jgi:hypothetical protein